MNILGLTSGSESGACLFRNGRLQLAVSEERLTRTKFDDRFPAHAIDWILRESCLTVLAIDLICYGFSREFDETTSEQTEIDRLLSSEKDLDIEASTIIHQRIATERKVDHGKRQLFFAELRQLFPDTPVYNCGHHQAHQAAAFAPSPFREALVITADGRGDFKSLTIARADRTSGLTELYASPSWRSLGYFYGRLTHLCGFTANRHEGKVTGLAAYGNPLTALTFIESILRFSDNRIDPSFGELYTPFFSNYSPSLIEQAGQYCREDLAAATQWQLEKIVCQLVEQYASATGIRQVCLAGGIFANVKLNQKIRQLADIDEIFVYPAMSDAGICAGSVFHYLMTHDTPPPRLEHVFLGPHCELTAASDKLKQCGIDLTVYAEPIDRLVELLAEQTIIGLVAGRAEFGPRALGHRSIVASAFNPTVTGLINRKLQRDDFMPFAPAIAEDFASQCLQNYRSDCLSAEFMTLSFPVSKEFAENSPAAVHVDRTVRPQIVTRQANPFFHDLLLAWKQKTGGLCLLNTSFNIHEEPIVNSVDDIIRALQQNAVDVVFTPPNLFLTLSQSTAQ